MIPLDSKLRPFLFTCAAENLLARCHFATCAEQLGMLKDNKGRTGDLFPHCALNGCAVSASTSRTISDLTKLPSERTKTEWPPKVALRHESGDRDAMAEFLQGPTCLCIFFKEYEIHIFMFAASCPPRLRRSLRVKWASASCEFEKSSGSFQVTDSKMRPYKFAVQPPIVFGGNPCCKQSRHCRQVERQLLLVPTWQLELFLPQGRDSWLFASSQIVFNPYAWRRSKPKALDQTSTSRPTCSKPSFRSLSWYLHPTNPRLWKVEIPRQTNLDD